jgi:hypothetical protein
MHFYTHGGKTGRAMIKYPGYKKNAQRPNRALYQIWAKSTIWPCSSDPKNLHTGKKHRHIPRLATAPLQCIITGMSPIKWLLLIVFLVSAYWLWPIYLLIAVFAVFGSNTGTRSRTKRTRPYKFKTRKLPVYKPVRYKAAKPYRFPKTRRKWGRPVKIDKVWKL